MGYELTEGEEITRPALLLTSDLKSEVRNPNPERNPNSELRTFSSPEPFVLRHDFPDAKLISFSGFLEFERRISGLIVAVRPVTPAGTSSGLILLLRVQGALVAFHGLGVFLQSAAQSAFVKISNGQSAVGSDGAVVAFQRFLRLPRFLQGGAFFHERIGVGGFDGQNFIETSDRIFGVVTG